MLVVTWHILRLTCTFHQIVLHSVWFTPSLLHWIGHAHASCHTFTFFLPCLIPLDLRLTNIFTSFSVVILLCLCYLTLRLTRFSFQDVLDTNIPRQNDCQTPELEAGTLMIVGAPNSPYHLMSYARRPRQTPSPDAFVSRVYKTSPSFALSNRRLLVLLSKQTDIR